MLKIFSMRYQQKKNAASEIVQKIKLESLLNSILQQTFYNQFFMEYQAKMSNKPKNYAKIPLNKRIKLVELVLQKSLSIAKASAKLGIRPSTAKLILKKYREEGAFFEKRSDKLSRLATVKAAQQPSDPAPTQQVSLNDQYAYQGPQMFTFYPAQYHPYVAGQSMLFTAGEWNVMQNHSFGGLANYNFIQYTPTPFYI